MTVALKKQRNAAATRESILMAAKQHFIQNGYDQTGVRAIASDAGIDPALICRYFGSKANLFTEVLTSTTSEPIEIFTQSREHFGERVAEMMVEPERHFPECRAFIRLVSHSSGNEEANATTKQHLDTNFIHPFSEWLGGENAEERSWLILSILMGLTLTDDFKPLQVDSTPMLAAMLQSVIDQ